MTSEIIPTNQDQALTEVPAKVKIIPMALLWESFLLATGKHSKNTAKAYQNGVGYFLQFLGELQGVDIARTTKQGRKTVWELRGDTTPLLDVDLKLLDRYSLWLQDKGNKPATVNQRLAGVNSFMSVALRDSVIDFEQGQRLDIRPYKAKQKRNEQPVGRRLSAAEVRDLRAAVDQAGNLAVEKGRSDNKAIRDQAILDFMLYAGLRRDEVANLGIADFRQDGGRWWMIVTGKGGKARRLKVHDRLFETLGYWLKVTGASLGNGDSGPVFYNLTKSGQSTGKPLNASVIGRLVAEYGYLAGLTPEKAPRDEKTGRPVRGILLSPHDLRRTCARNAYDHEATIYQVQTMLGHSDPKTTIRYIGALDDDSNTAIDKVNY